MCFTGKGYRDKGYLSEHVLYVDTVTGTGKIAVSKADVNTVHMELCVYPGKQIIALKAANQETKKGCHWEGGRI